MKSALFSPISLRGLTLPNRIVVSPMCQYSAVDGSATDWHLMHLGKFAVSGAGLVIVEATHVEARGRITHGCLGLYNDENERQLRGVVEFCHKAGNAKIGMQISHSGRKGSARLPWVGRGEPLPVGENPWETIAPSAMPHAPGWPAPRELDCAGLDVAKVAHVDATRRAARIGIDLIEVHIAHGYFLHEFLSPLSNKRTDNYGGSLESRMRYPLEVFAAMRAVWPADRPMGVRHSVTDWAEGGWAPADAEGFAAALKELGCDYITATTGGLSVDQKIPIGEGHQIKFARYLRDRTGVPTMAVGMIFDPHHAERIIRDGDADFVALARGVLSDPHWPWRAAAALDADVSYPVQYVRGYKSNWLRSMRGTGEREASQ
ncbi:MAG: NADH:flavin oxidoreductase/NADH oxidase [Pseudolabrys sp.]|nr:NADH:flavin oxidoreductase/NADH oxidase [Pseudolabrys sp.]MDP2297030.1 NADH:flavin oxidoreductase/NADH oxidase [Pseudolabrys sp.]